MIKLPSLQELLEAGVHFGHKKERSYPKSRQFTYMVRDGIFVINLEKTKAHLENALQYMTNLTKEGKTILLVGTKRQASEVIEKVGKETGMPYINHKWLGGTLTNFETIRSSIKRMEELEAQKKSPEYDKLTKKEKASIDEEIRKIEENLGGIKDMTRLPDALFIVDPVTEKNAVNEANKLGIPMIAIADTNANPTLIDFPIPANDDARKSVELLVGMVGEAIKEGQSGKKEVKEKEEEKKEEND